MKNYIIIIILFIAFGADEVSAQFTNPFGYTGRLKAVTKEIGEGQHSSGITWPKAIKWTTSNRRYDLDITFKESTWYSSGGCGWNKAARISFIRNNNTNENKMHIGWQAIEEAQDNILLSLFFHDGPESQVENNWVAHKIDTIYIDTKTAVDMFLGHDIIAMIVNDKALGIRKNGWIPDTKRSFLSKTFYFGGTCGAPQDMEAYFEDQKYDWSGYDIKFNSQVFMIWNLSEFEYGDSFSYNAGKEINGSINRSSDVDFNGGHPNPVKQKCIIHAGTEISFTAGEKVHLHPGFHAKPGSYFRAKIARPAKININNIPQEFDELISYGVKNVKSVELSFYINPSLDSLVYGKQFYVKPRSSIAKTTIDTILPLKKYYAVANFYSGKGSQKRIEGWVNNSNYGFKQSITGADSPFITSDYSIYPNPSNGVFNIKLSNPDFISSLKVINTQGQPVLTMNKPNSTNIVIDISNQQKGIYVLLVNTQIGIKTYKLVKK